ncbi:MAG: N-acetyl-gamma-glutamyl-phosphate reductase [Pseudomonadales bacterium]|jgi:N-acetyl-gamma-glutamyl-phosphate reductase
MAPQSTKVFIDGQAGTTGLQIAQRLLDRDDIHVKQIDPAERKDPQARARQFEQCDVAILCLPDAAAIEAVALAQDNCRIIDASTAHRVDDGWCYGLPELDAAQRARIADAQRVSNPGCYPQGFILMIRPLIDAGLLSSTQPLTMHAVSGYSGGGRALIESREAFTSAQVQMRNTEPYGLTLEHKHLPEMQRYSGSSITPLFTPIVGHYYQGMLVQVPLFTRDLENQSTLDDLHRVLADRYAGEPFITVLDPGAASVLDEGFLNPTACNDTNRVEIMLFGNAERLLLVARYDNLGKGAAGAAVQNLNLMIGAPETTGLNR